MPDSDSLSEVQENNEYMCCIFDAPDYGAVESFMFSYKLSQNEVSISSKIKCPILYSLDRLKLLINGTLNVNILY